MRIPFNKPFIAGRELEYIRQAVMVEGHLAANGKFTRLCQQWLQQTLGCGRAFLTHSCTAALEMAALVCGIGEGDEVIMPSFTFVSTANAFVLRGAVPVFVDIRPDTLNMDERLAAAAVTARTRAVVPVHYAGVPCAMDAIMDLASRHGLRVIEDTAQALLSDHRGRFLGTIGDAGCLSFHETKNIICGEGGALLLSDPALIARAQILWEKGTNRSSFIKGECDKYSWVDIGSSFYPSELVSAFLFAQLEEAQTIVAARRRIFEAYHRALRPMADEGLFDLPSEFCLRHSNAHIFYLLCRSEGERGELIRHLGGDGILAVFHYVPLHSSPAGRTYGKVFGEMRHTDGISRRLLRLPLYRDMREEELRAVISSVTAFYA